MYTINRFVEEKSSQGADEIFIDITITDDLGVYVFGHWLTDEEFTRYKEDENNLEDIIDNLLPLAKSQKEQEIFAIANPVEDEFIDLE